MDKYLPLILAGLELGAKALTMANEVRAGLNEADEAKLKAKLAEFQLATDAALDTAINKADAAAKL